MFSKSEVFLEPKSIGAREWGEELMLYAASGAYTFKVLKINSGSKGGLQYHRRKDECAFIVSGEMIIRYDLDDGLGLQETTISANQAIRFPPGMVHQEEAVTDVLILEVSTPHLNDRVRVESKYGFDEVEGLPTTEEKDIITL